MYTFYGFIQNYLQDNLGQNVLKRVVDYATLLYKVGGEKPKTEENICVSALQRWTICKDRKGTGSTGYIKGKLGGWENTYSDHSF